MECVRYHRTEYECTGVEMSGYNAHEHKCLTCGGIIAVPYNPSKRSTIYQHFLPNQTEASHTMEVTDLEFDRIGNNPQAIQAKIQEWDKEVHDAVR
jgi:hypothetical protein